MTGEETTLEELQRNVDLYRRLRDGLYGLPFDFDKYDHQRQTEEVKEMERIYVRAATI